MNDTPNLQQMVGMGVGTFGVVGLVDVLAHLGPTGLVVGGIAAYVAAKHGPDIAQQVKQMLPVAREEEPQTFETRDELPTSTRTWKDRLLGRPGRDVPRARSTEEDSPLAREYSEWEDGQDEDDTLILPRQQGQMFLFSEVLRTFRPSASQIFLARSQDRQNLTCTASELCHVAIAGNTGGGKSSIERMLLLQLCKAGLQVLILNPHYTDYDIDNNEDWTPFKPYLTYDPMECRKYEVIEHFLKTAAEELIPCRLEKRANSQPVGKPYFLVIDELPSIVRKIKNAPEYLRVILEEGRKVKVYVISAAQDFLVKTISPDAGGGSIRECYRTAYSVGGDSKTSSVLLDMPARLIPEDELGKGVAMLRSVPTKKATKVLVPYVDNESLYRLLGPSTYRKARFTEPENELDFELPTTQPAIATVSQVQGSTQVSREQLLETINALAEIMDEQTLVRLMKQLPPVREDEPEEPLTLLEQGVQAYQDGKTSIMELATALDISPWEARQLLPKVKIEVKRIGA